MGFAQIRLLRFSYWGKRHYYIIVKKNLKKVLRSCGC